MLVDDEDIVLTSIETFLHLETEYNLVTFLSARKALAFIESNDVSLVISDYLMPEIDGISFLAQVREIKPEIPRIILTGYADKENAIKAINEVGFFQYLEKPWDNDDLKIVIRNGIERQNLMKKLQEKMDEIDRAHTEMKSMHREILKTFV